VTGRTATVDTTTAPLPQDVVRTLETALLGITSCPPSGPLANPDTASAFLPGSSVQAVDLDPGLWALVRSNQRNDRTVLCVYNVSDQPVTFDPTRYLSIEDADRFGLLFLTGAARSYGSVAAPTVQVAAHSFVWLGHFSDADRPDSEGETR